MTALDATGRTVPPIALHLEWTTGQHIYFAANYDRQAATSSLLRAAHLNMKFHGLPLGVCAPGAGSMRSHARGRNNAGTNDLYTRPAGLKAKDYSEMTQKCGG